MEETHLLWRRQERRSLMVMVLKEKVSQVYMLLHTALASSSLLQISICHYQID